MPMDVGHECTLPVLQVERNADGHLQSCSGGPGVLREDVAVEQVGVEQPTGHNEAALERLHVETPFLVRVVVAASTASITATATTR